MELMRQVLQDYCTEKGHNIEEGNNGYRLYFKGGWATQLDILFLVHCAEKYGWHFFISSERDNCVYAVVYEPILPLAA